MKIKLDDVKNAYRKLKSYVYYDSTLYFFRKRLAKFENKSDFGNKLKKLTFALNCKEEDSNYFLKKVKQIDYKLIPKSFVNNEENTDYEENVITNNFEKENYLIERYTYLIDAPIEIHIIAVLWILKVGYKLDNDCSINSYGYQLEKSDITAKVKKGLKLFKPYFTEYRNWRDNAINEAIRLSKENKDVAILGLDIKDFFHKVRLPFADISDSFLTRLLKKIYCRYTEKVSDKKLDKPLLPIGLLSSSVLANWYLKKFDTKIEEELNPIYYGRYVDDILIVLSNPVIDKNKPLTSIIEKYLLNKAQVLDPKNEEGEYKINITKGDEEDNDYKELYIQQKKLKLYDLKANGSDAILEKFKENIRKNSSEFRLLPENYKIENEFKYEAHSILYSDSINKLRSIEAFKCDKYKASIYLTKKLYATRLWDEDKKDVKRTAKQILNFFKGELCLKFHSLWEKVFTYFIIENLKDEFLQFYEYVIKLISKINFVEKEDDFKKDKLKKDLKEYLEICIFIPLALNPKFYDDDMNFKLKKISLKLCLKTNENINMQLKEKDKDDNKKFKDNLVWEIRRSNLIRHLYVFYPLINYTKLALNENLEFNLLSKKPLDGRHLNIDKNNTLDLNNVFDLDHKARVFSPRFIKFNEITNFVINKRLFLDDNNELKDLFVDYLDESFDLFYEINCELGSIQIDNSITDNTHYKTKYFKLNDDIYDKNIDKERFKIDALTINSNNKKNQVVIAVANMKLSFKNLEDSFLGKPNLKTNRREQLYKLLNLSYEEKVDGKEADIVIFPETSIPYVMLPLLADYSRRHQKAIICGLEHYVNNENIAYNLIVTILPFKVNDCKHSLIKIRVKNHYAPEEKMLLTGNGLNIPIPNKYQYDLFNWQGIYFSCYNCYELANIEHRSLFKSKVDLLIASVYNKDVNYFSNIVESISRDVHCYFVQVNSSNYGDSRITQPAETYKKDILKIKGGENPALMLGKIDLKSLREFQSKEYKLQKEIDDFKSTPPDFDRNEVRKRMGLRIKK